MDAFSDFYFSRTRNSLEHFFPQARLKDTDGKVSEDQINCLGNYAMIGAEMNSSGSDWYPYVKLSHYQDLGKVNKVSVSSLKFQIMMQKCRYNKEKEHQEDCECWGVDDIDKHQNKMKNILLDDELLLRRT